MTVLSATNIKALLQQSGAERELVIVPRPKIEGRDLGQASVDLKLGRWFVTLKQSKQTHVQLGIQNEHTPIPTRRYFVPFGQEFVLHPGRFVLAVTLEWLKLGKGVAGYIMGKSSLGRKGLIIETAAAIHPGFSGCLTLELANMGEAPLSVVPGMPICQLFVHRVEGGVEVSRSVYAGARRPQV